MKFTKVYLLLALLTVMQFLIACGGEAPVEPGIPIPQATPVVEIAEAIRYTHHVTYSIVDQVFTDKVWHIDEGVQDGCGEQETLIGLSIRNEAYKI